MAWHLSSPGRTIKAIIADNSANASEICQERSIPRACRGCLTPSPHVTEVLTLSLARSDHFALVLGTSHTFCIALHSFACFLAFLLVFLVSRLNRLGGDSVFALSLYFPPSPLSVTLSLFSPDVGRSGVEVRGIRLQKVATSLGIHFKINTGRSKAVAIAALSNQNPGVITVENAMFGSTPPISKDVLTKALKVDGNMVKYLQ